jgi:hypothetical protein
MARWTAHGGARVSVRAAVGGADYVAILRRIVARVAAATRIVVRIVAVAVVSHVVAGGAVVRTARVRAGVGVCPRIASVAPSGCRIRGYLG